MYKLCPAHGAAQSAPLGACLGGICLSSSRATLSAAGAASLAQRPPCAAVGDVHDLCGEIPGLPQTRTPPRQRQPRQESSLRAARFCLAAAFALKASRRRACWATSSSALVVDESATAEEFVPVQADQSLPETLGESVAYLLAWLRGRHCQVHDKIRDHELPVRVPKRFWTHMGALVKAREEYPHRLPDDKWVTLRLDGCGWGTLLKSLVAKGVLDAGFNDGIGAAMQACCRAVMVEFGGVLAYTHSDELIVLVPPAQSRKGVGPRVFGGAVQEWASVSASVASGQFNKMLTKFAAERGVRLDDTLKAHFDSRVGVYDTAEEALGLVFWRASDCHVNSASDAIKFSEAPMQVRRYNTIEKLCYLQQRDMLPLRRHQAYGSLLTEVAAESGGRRFVLVNSGEGGMPMHVLNLAKLGSLLPGHALGDSVPAMLPDYLPERDVWRPVTPMCSTADAVHSD